MANSNLKMSTLDGDGQVVLLEELDPDTADLKSLVIMHNLTLRKVSFTWNLLHLLYYITLLPLSLQQTLTNVAKNARKIIIYS